MKTLLKFKDQNKEIEFWKKNDITDFFDVKSAKVVRFSNLKKALKLYR